MSDFSKPPPAMAGAAPVAVAFTASLFLSAGLLFFIQPMFAKLVLPRLGGAPAVWTTAMLFFQTTLLAGYAYAHLIGTRLSLKAQLGVQGTVMLAGAAVLPIALPGLDLGDTSLPVTLQALALFALGVGLPFFALSANAPLLQRWYAAAGGPRAEDPYFLYAASNAGSLIALLAFPLAVEPLFGTRLTSWGWSLGYGLLCFGIAACGVFAARGPAERPAVAPVAVTRGHVIYWMALAFVPSSMMLSVTAAITTDIGSFPLIWVIPLSLYLLSFVIAFSGRLFPSRRPLELGFVVVLAPTVVMTVTKQASGLGWAAFALLVATFALAALLFHRRLYEARPPAGGLTAFYLAMSAGGALGGVFNGVVAPAVFDDVYEIMAVLAVASLILPGPRELRRDTVWVGAGFLAISAVIIAGSALELFDGGRFGLYLLCATMAAALLALARRPAAFSGLAATLFTLAVIVGASGSTLERERSFFGVYTVHEDEGEGLRKLIHGTTVHGAQWLDTPPGARPEVLSYYHRSTPIGQAFEGLGPHARVGVVGLGIGAVACYARPGQNWRFYEIDPVVDRLARDPALFGFMANCAGDAPTVIGDARLVLERETAQQFDLLLVDAFSSDSVPVHLLTREALAIYRDRLAPGGRIVLHTSNRFFNLARIIAPSAQALGLVARERRLDPREDGPLERGANPTMAVIVAVDDTHLTGFGETEGWKTLQPRPWDRGWTDDNSSLLTILR